MKIIDYISCPVCGLYLKNDRDFLICDKCTRKYDIINGIPVLIDLIHLPKHLQKQVIYFENENSVNQDYQLKEWQKSYLDKFSSNFLEFKNKIIIDCGTGSGYMAIELAKKGALVIACDLTLKSLVRLNKIAKDEGLSDKIFTVCCSAETLPFRKGIADYFISNAVLEHLPREKEAISEIYRVCKTGAGIMIAAPLSYKFLNPLLFLINYVHDRRIGHIRRYDLSILKKRFSNCDIISVYYTGHFMKVFKSLFNLVFRCFDEIKIEQHDKIRECAPFNASNIICFLRIKY